MVVDHVLYPLHRHRSDAIILAFLVVALTTPCDAQTGNTVPERIAWPLVDFVVLGDSAHGVQLIAAPNLHTVQGQGQHDNMTLTLEPQATRRWAASVAHLVDSVARLEPNDRSPFVTVPLVANLGKAELIVSLDGRGRREAPFLFVVAESVGKRKGWNVQASAQDIRDLLTVIDATAQTSVFDTAPHRADGEGVYLACQLDHPPRLRDGERVFYPMGALSGGQEGRVLAEFVIDSSGKARPGSFRALLSDGGSFSDAVRDAVMHARFVPGKAHEQAVSTLVWQWFAFRIHH